MGNTSSSGNLVNAGNCDPKGANVNNDQPDNSNDNLGALVVRNFLLAWITPHLSLKGAGSVKLPLSI